MKISEVEGFSLTKILLEELDTWGGRNSCCHPIVAGGASHIIGFFVTPFTCLIDALAHTILCIGKTITGLVVTPFNFVARRFFPEKLLSEEFELGSALVHFVVATHSFAKVYFLPFIALVSTRNAKLIADPARIFKSDLEIFAEALGELSKLGSPVIK